MEEEAQVFKLATTSSKANAATVDYFLIKVKTILKRGGSDEVLDLMIDEILLKSAKLRSVSSSQNLLQLIPNLHSDARDVVALLHPSTWQTLASLRLCVRMHTALHTHRCITKT